MKVESVRTITDIIDAETGKLLHIDDEFFYQNEAYLVLLKRKLFEYAYLRIGKPKYLCAVCQQPLVLLSRKYDGRVVAFFAHYKDSKDCPIKTHCGEMDADAIRRSIYVGESEEHSELKHQISSALNTSHINSIPFSHIKEKERVPSKLDFRLWARPNIYAECGNLKISFEVQVSSLFLSTVIERDIYYRFHKIFVIWIFTPGVFDSGTMMLKDAVWANNGNIFTYDYYAKQITEKTGELTLLCQWYEPVVEGRGIKMKLNKGKYITLSELTFDQDVSTVYYVDVASKFESVYPKFKSEKAELEQMELEALDEYRVLLDGAKPTKEEVLRGIESGLYRPRWIKKGSYWGYAKYGYTIIPFIYNYAEDFVNGFAIVRRNRRYGIVDIFGKEVIEPKYYKVEEFRNGYAKVYNDEGLLGFINDKGEEVVEPKYRKITNFRNGVAKVYDDNGNVGLVSLKHGFIVSPKYRKITEFKDGLARVYNDEHYCGIIDEKGEEIVKPYFCEIGAFEGGYAMVLTDGYGWGRINRDGSFMVRNGEMDFALPTKYSYGKDFVGGFAQVWAGQYWGLINDEGEEVLEPRYDLIENFKDGYAKIAITDEANGYLSSYQWGLIGNDGRVVVKPKYHQIEEFSEGFAAVCLDNNWGFINTKGEEVIKPTYYNVGDFKNGTAIVMIDASLQGRIDYEGNFVVRNGDVNFALPSKYKWGKDFENGFAQVSDGKHWGLINVNGDEIIKPQYDKIEEFKDGYAKIAVKKGFYELRWGLIDIYGNEILEPKYDGCRRLSNGLLAIYINGKWGIVFVNETGEESVTFQYSRIDDCDFEYAKVVVNGDDILQGRINRVGLFVIRNENEDFTLPARYKWGKDFENGFAQVSDGELWGIIDVNGNVIVEPKYHKIENLKDGLARIAIRFCDTPPLYHYLYGIINAKGREIIEPKYSRIGDFNEGFAIIGDGNVYGLINDEGKVIVSPQYKYLSEVTNGIAKATTTIGNNICIDIFGVEYDSIWDYYCKTKKKAKTIISTCKDNGYECADFECGDSKYHRSLFIPNSLSHRSMIEGEEIEVYIVKGDDNPRRSIIASTMLCTSHILVDEEFVGTITRVEKYGILVKINNSNITALAHISTFNNTQMIKSYAVGERVRIKVISKDDTSKRINIKVL